MRILTVFIFLAVVLFGDGDDHERYEHGKQHMPLDMRYLELSDAQQREIRQIMKTFRAEHKAYHAREKSLTHEIEALFASERFDSRTYARRVTELKREAVEIQSRFLKRMHAVLTPGQRIRFIDFMEEWDVE